MLKQTSILTIWLSARFGARQVLNIAAFFFIAAITSPELVGLGSVAAAIGLLARLPLHRGIRDLVIQAPKTAPELLNTAFTMNLLFGTAVSALIALVGLLVMLLGGDSDLAALIAVSAIIPLVSGPSSFFEAMIERRRGHAGLAALQLAASAAAALIAVTAALWGWGAWPILILSIVEAVAVAIGVVMLARYRPRFSAQWSAVKPQLGFSAPITVSSVLNGGFLWIVVIATGVFAGMAAAAQIRIAMKLFQLLIQGLCAPVYNALLVTVSRNGEPLDRQAMLALSATASVFLPAFAGAAAISPALIPAMLGGQWAQAGELSRIICLAGLGLPFIYAIEPCLIAAAKTRAILIVSVLRESLGGLLLIAALLTAEPVWIAAAFAARGASNALVYSGAANRVLGSPLQAPWARAAAPMLASAITAAASIAVLARLETAPPVVALGASIAAGVCAYAASLTGLGATLPMRVRQDMLALPKLLMKTK